VVPCRGDPGSGRLAAREPGQALTGAAMSVTVGVLRAPVFVLFFDGWSHRGCWRFWLPQGCCR